MFQGFTFQDLFSKCSYTKNERECVLKIINRIDSHFIPFYEPPTLYYSCNFLQNLNKNVCIAYMNFFFSLALSLYLLNVFIF